MGETTIFDRVKIRTPLDKNSIAAQGVETLDFFIAGDQTTGALKAAKLVGVAGTIIDVRARALAAPVGAAMIADVNKNGTTLFTTQSARPTIADGATVSSTTLPAVTAVAAGDYLSVDVDQIGSGTAGANLLVSVTIKHALV